MIADRDALASIGLDLARVLPSEWALAHRRIADLVTKEIGPWTFEYCPWLVDFLDDFSREIVIMKGAQLCWTEGTLTKVLAAIDVFRRSALYCFPSDDGASVFSASRFDPAISLSPRLAALFGDVANVGHKRAGAANLWLRGMNSREGLKSIDPAILVRDEREEMPAWAIALSDERVTGQMDPQTIDLSTPSIPGKGIDADWQNTDRKRWMVPCAWCRARVFLTWSSIRWDGDDATTAAVHCEACRARWEEVGRKFAVRAGIWVPERAHPRSGYRVGKVCGLVPSATPEQLVARYLRVRMNPSQLQEFMNGLGEPYVADGLQLTPALVEACIRDYPTAQAAIGRDAVSMGVDVGGRLHYRISEPRPDTRDPSGNGRRVLRAGEVQDFEDIDELMRSFGVGTCVIDANPERRKAREFQERWGGAASGRVFLAFYPGDPKMLAAWNEEDGTVNVHRTEAMDATLSRFRYPAAGAFPHGTVDLPRGLPSDFAAQMCAPARVLEETKGVHGAGTRAVYRENGPDHYAHASLYDEIAALRTGSGAEAAPPEPERPRENRTGMRAKRGLWR